MVSGMRLYNAILTFSRSSVEWELQEYVTPFNLKEEFFCDQCGYKAKNSLGLKIHQRVHKTRSYKTK